jgi:hypothetical protein
MTRGDGGRLQERPYIPRGSVQAQEASRYLFFGFSFIVSGFHAKEKAKKQRKALGVSPCPPCPCGSTKAQACSER